MVGGFPLGVRGRRGPLAAALYERFVAGSLRPRGTFDNTNFFAEFMAVAGVLCLSRFLAKGERSAIRMVSAVGEVSSSAPRLRSPHPGR